MTGTAGRRRWRAVLAAGALLAVAACGGEGAGRTGAAGGQGGRLSIATGGTSGVYYVYGGGLANVISKNLPGTAATAEATSASVDNMRLIDAKRSNLAFVLADTATDAVRGRESFTAPVKAAALAQLYTNYTHVVAKAGTGIDTVADLRGKRVSIGSPGSGTEVIALRVLEAAGLNADRDLRKAGLGVGESVGALRDGTIDAFFWSGGLPTAGVTDLATSDRIVLLPTAQYLSALQGKYGQAYQRDVIPSGTYKGVDRQVEVVGVPNLLVVNQEMPEEQAYQITRLLFTQKDALVAVHPEAKNLDVQRGRQTGEVPLHPGAQRYFDEAK